MTSNYFQRVQWHHESGDDPVVLWAHVVDGWEVRKVDEFADGRLEWAGEEQESGGTWLSEVPMPSTGEVGGDPQFTVEIVDERAFERVWEQARGGS
ncbi:DUF6881 domain-containing protein [Promicromonospora iranensis]|uniref:DUF6881 domain-containing protein n=1 Tax=Promicromonospora iranensis TaxID=1105144 RepID=UPI0023A980A2|nr:hypothetical protein [Promicromonospora iranensis]